MHIEIANRFHPFSHRVGSFVTLASSNFSFRITPKKIEVYDVNSEVFLGTIEIPFTQFEVGPFSDFTIEQDLEAVLVRVYGFSKLGYFRYTLSAVENSSCFVFKAEKGDLGEIVTEGVNCKNVDSKTWVIGKLIQNDNSYSPIDRTSSFERLSLGSHKSQDIDLIYRRDDFKEILPLWHRLGKLVKGDIFGKSKLIDRIKNSLFEENPKHIIDAFRALFLAGFKDLFVPKRIDDNYQGILEGPIVEEGSLLYLLQEGSRLISSLFVQEKENCIQLLPYLPPEFHSGRLLHVPINMGHISIEWSKKRMRRATLFANKTAEISIQFNRDEKRCRIRSSNKDKGIIYHKGDTLKIIEGKEFWFDNFEK